MSVLPVFYAACSAFGKLKKFLKIEFLFSFVKRNKSKLSRFTDLTVDQVAEKYCPEIVVALR